MKTPQQKSDEQQQSSNSTMTTSPDRSAKKNNNKKTKSSVSFPTEILENILSRVPAKSILRSKSVSKPWLSLLSGSQFTNLHFSRATTTHRRTAFFISAYDASNRKCYYLTAANHGGAVTKLMTVDNDTRCDITERSHLNGLVCFTSRTWAANPTRINSNAFIVNPATRKVYQLDDMNCGSKYGICGYFYGFDEVRKEHKVLLIKRMFKTETYEFMIFSLSSYSWRKIDVDTPVGFDWGRRLSGLMGGGVCVNSKVHMMLNDLSYDILAFDFVTERFEVISIPEGVLPPDANPNAGVGRVQVYMPAVTKINGCLGVVFINRKRSKVGIWTLQDYKKRVWVNETVKFPKCWNDLVGQVPPTIDGNMDGEIVFCLGKKNENVVSVPVYNMKTKRFRSVEFTLDDQFASPKSVTFCHISCYVETITPLVNNWSKTSHVQGDKNALE